MAAERVERGVSLQIQRIKRAVVPVLHALADLLQADAAHAGDRVGEVLVDDVLPDADRLEDLRALVGLKHRNAHLGGHAAHAAHHRADVVLLGGMAVLVQQALFDQLIHALERQIRVDRPGAIAQKQRKVVHVARVGGLKKHADRRAPPGADQMLLQRGHRQQRGNGHVVFIHAPVGQNQHVRAVLVGAVAGHEQVVERVLQRLAAVVQHRDPRHVQGLLVGALDAQQVGIGQDGLFQAQHGAILRPVLKQVPVAAHVHRRVGDDLLADGVDGRVGDLCEQLPEVGKQRLVLFREHGQRNVGPHGGGRFRPGLRHGQDDLLDLLVGVAERLVHPVAQRLAQRRDGMVGQRQVAQRQQVSVQPLAIGLPGGVGLLELAVLHDALLHGVHQQHLAGAHARLADDFLRRDVQHAHLAGENQQVVVGDVVAGRAQAVSVQHRAHHVAVREENRGRAVPGLHHRGVITVQVAAGSGNIALALPGLRNGHHHGQGKRHAVHHQELQRVVQHGGVASACVDDREHLVDVPRQHRGGQRLFPGDHAVHIAPDGVDLAVVQDQAVGVRALPAGEGVGREAGVHHRQGAGKVLALQIPIECAQLAHQEHALVDDRAAGHRADVAVGVALLKHAPRHIQLAVKVQAPRQLLRARDEALLDHRHARAGALAQHLRADRHLTPAQKPQALLLGHDLHQLARLGALEAILRHEQHGDAIVALRWQFKVQRLFFKKGVGYLQHDAHAVAGAAVGVLACAMLQLLDNFQRLVDRLAALDAVNADHRANAACVVLKLGQVQSPLPVHFLLHMLHSSSDTDYSGRRPPRTISPATSAILRCSAMLFFCR